MKNFARPPPQTFVPCIRTNAAIQPGVCSYRYSLQRPYRNQRASCCLRSVSSAFPLFCGEVSNDGATPFNRSKAIYCGAVALRHASRGGSCADILFLPVTVCAEKPTSAVPLLPPRRIASCHERVPLTRLSLALYCDGHLALYTRGFSCPATRGVPCSTLRLARSAVMRRSSLRHNGPATRRERVARLLRHTWSESAPT